MVSMFVHAVHTKTKSGKISHTCYLLRHTYRESGKVKTKTLCNLNHCSLEQIQAMKIALKDPEQIINSLYSDVDRIFQGESIGALWTVYDIAKQIGIEAALGTDREGKIAMFQVLSRVISQGSRLSAARNLSQHAVCDILGIKEDFNEDHLYKNLAWLESKKNRIENRLLKNRRTGNKNQELFLYDVTSSYLEGDKNAFANYGYNRDGKKGKKQIVIGLLCDEEGLPISIELFEGNTNDLKTFQTSIDKVKDRYKCDRITFVGDRGMIKSEQIAALKEKKFFYITAIAKQQIKSLISNNVIQPEIFDKELVEIEHESIRYILRRNPVRACEIISSRHSKIKAIRILKKTKIEYLKERPRAKIDAAVKAIEKRIKKLKLEKYLNVLIQEGKIILKINLKNMREVRKLDGCYVLKSNLPPAVSLDVIHSRYKDLALVENAFRTEKTTFLEIRPWYVRTRSSSIGHALVVMLSYHIVHHLRKVWNNINLTVEEAIDSLSKLCMMKIKTTNGTELNQIPTPDETNLVLLEAANVILPSILPSTGARVSSRKDIGKKRKTA